MAADADFNGRWDIKVRNEPRSRVWWLGVEGAGTSKIKGSFVGAPGGDCDVIPKIAVRNGELEWRFQKPYRRGGQTAEGVYKAKIIDGKLVGSLEVDGVPDAARTFEGVRAPVIPDKDNASWKKGKPVELFNGKDLNNWKPMIKNVPLGWTVEDGITSNKAGANNLVSDEKFWNFELHAEIRLGKDSNAGLGLRGRYEVQVLEDFGKPADTHGNGALYSRILPASNASKAPGEWQTYDIRLVGRTVTVILNGVKVIDRKEIVGLTAMAHDADEALPGPISVQGDHGAVEFRKLTVTPLVASSK